MNGVAKFLPWAAILALLVGAAVGYGALGQQVDDNRKQGERRDVQFGQMDMRQRTLENNAAATAAILKLIKESVDKIDRKLDRRAAR